MSGPQNRAASQEDIQAVANALTDADRAFHYDIRLMRLVDGESTYRLTMAEGESEHPSYDDAVELMGSRRNRDRANAILAALGHWPEGAATFGDAGLHRIGQERWRQLAAEGWTADHDDKHDDNELRRAAQGYLSAVEARDQGTTEGTIARDPPDDWPWAERWWKPRSSIRDLERAGALIAAELSRRLRAHDAFLKLVVEACVAGGADRDHAVSEVGQVVPDHLKEEGIEVGAPNYDWGPSGAGEFAEELVLQHLDRDAPA